MGISPIAYPLSVSFTKPPSDRNRSGGFVYMFLVKQIIQGESKVRP